MSVFNSGCCTTVSGTGVQPINFGYSTLTDAFGRLRVSQPYTLFDSQQRFGLDTTFVSNVASGGSITYVEYQSTANLTVTNTAGSFASRETKQIFQYQPGKSLLILATFVMAPISSGNLRQRVGYFGISNGMFLELSDQLYIVRRSNSTGSISNTYVPQSAWNYDKMDGTGPSGFTLDITTSQIWWSDFEWLGVGNVRVGFVLNGQFCPCHIFQHANYAKYAYITTACLPIRYEIQSLTSSGPASSNLLQICSTVISEGGYDPPLTLYSNVSVFTSSMTAGVWYPAISIRLVQSRLEGIVSIRQVDVGVSGTDIIQWALWSNVSAGNLTGGAWAPHYSSSMVEVLANATAFTTTGCYQVASGIIVGTNQTGSTTALSLDRYFSKIGRNSFTNTSDIFTLALYNTAASTNPKIISLLSWNEVL